MNRRFVIQRLSDSGKVWEYIATVYAEQLKLIAGHGCGHFFRDGEIIGSVEVGLNVRCFDSTGVMVPKELVGLSTAEQREAVDAWRAIAPPAIVEVDHV